MKGIDISSYQADVDFQQVKDSGVEVVYLKATEGRTWQDSTFEEKYRAAKAVGLKVGVYHFLRGNSPQDEVNNFLSMVGDKEMDCKYAIDAEVDLGGIEVTSQHVREFADILLSKGKDVVLYTYTSFYYNNLNDSVKDLPLWIANYSSDPKVSSYIGWQYADNGYTPGVGNCDVNNFSEGIFIGSVASTPVQVQPVEESPIDKGRKFVGDRCKELQEKLTKCGYDCRGIDGVFGQNTYNALISFQQANNLVVDGLAGTNTFAKLDAIIAEMNRPKVQVNQKVLSYQKAVNAMNIGVYLVEDGILGQCTLGSVESLPLIQVGSYNAMVGWIQGVVGCSQDCRFGNITRSSVISYQSQNQLVPDGICGKNTITQMLTH